jgi:D-3-phosphoglycerate dehydrogenase
MAGPRILCAGDRFISARLLADSAAAALGEVEPVPYESAWPDEPFGDVDGVREAAGDPAVIAELAVDADALLTHLAPVTAAVLEAAAGLRVVGVTRGGPVNVDLAAATRRGVPVIYLPGRNLNAVAEFVIGVMIASCRAIVPASVDLARGRWDARWFRYDQTGPELGSSTIGLVGLGAVGSQVATLLRAFGATVLATDPFACADAARAVGARLVDLPELLASSDIVSLHSRLTPETRGMFGADEFAAMRPGARFINTARGELVDQSALTEALTSGHLGGAALDVFSPEPPDPDDPLLSRADVIATPHLAGASRQVAERSAHRVAAEVAGFLATGDVTHCANPEVFGG